MSSASGAGRRSGSRSMTGGGSRPGTENHSVALTPVADGHRSPACTATASDPPDDRNSGTPATDAASTALAPATDASTPGRLRNRIGARRQGAVENTLLTRDPGPRRPSPCRSTPPPP